MENKTPVDENKINQHYSDLLKQQINSADAAGEDVKEIPHNKPAEGSNKCSMFDGSMMNFTKIMEAFELIESFISADTDAMELMVEDGGEYDEKEVLEELDKIFTPVLVMQNFEKEIADKAQSEMESAKVLTERTVIQFDDESRMAQLIAVCSKLIAKAKNSKAWQMFKQAAELKKKAGLELQKDEYDAAAALAQKYLVNVSSSNPSSVARNAALELLPQTRH